MMKEVKEDEREGVADREATIHRVLSPRLLDRLLETAGTSAALHGLLAAPHCLFSRRRAASSPRKSRVKIAGSRSSGRCGGHGTGRDGCKELGGD